MLSSSCLQSIAIWLTDDQVVYNIILVGERRPREREREVAYISKEEGFNVDEWWLYVLDSVNYI